MQKLQSGCTIKSFPQYNIIQCNLLKCLLLIHLFCCIFLALVLLELYVHIFGSEQFLDHEK